MSEERQPMRIFIDENTGEKFYLLSEKDILKYKEDKAVSHNVGVFAVNGELYKFRATKRGDKKDESKSKIP